MRELRSKAASRKKRKANTRMKRVYFGCDFLLCVFVLQVIVFYMVTDILCALEFILVCRGYKDDPGQVPLDACDRGAVRDGTR